MNSPRDALGRAVRTLRLIVMAHEAGYPASDLACLAKCAVKEALEWDNRERALRVATFGRVKRRELPKSVRSFVHFRDQRMCGICDQPIRPDEVAHLDHVVALSRGGTNDPDNLRMTHAECNVKKGDA